MAPRPGERDAAARPVTLERVATAAGVSRQTVSNALNAPGRLHPDTLARVQQVIDELGYRPNRSARSLRTRSAGLIGYGIRPGGGLNPVLDRFLPSLCGAAEASGRRILLFSASRQSGADGEHAVYADLLARGAVDGFALSDLMVGDPRPGWLTERGVAFASFGRTWSDRQAGPWVDIDGAAGVEAAVRHLHEQGHRRIGFLGGSGPGGDRLGGWRRSCRALGLPADDALVSRGSDGTAGGRLATERLLGAPEPPTALVAVSDPLALGALRAISERGRTPGRDIGVTGFDDTPLATAAPPGLTSVRRPVEDAARHLVRLLDAAQLDPAPDPPHLLLAPTLVVRGSSVRQPGSAAPSPEA